MKPSSDFLLFLLCAALLHGALFPAPAAGVELDRIIAIVNDDVIMKSELEERLRTVEGQLEQNGTPVPPRSILEKQVLDRLILTKLQVQMANETGIRVDDETLNRTISNIAAENQVSLDEFRQILEKDGYSYERFREDIRGEILVSRLRQRQVDNRVTVTEREVENYLATQEHQGEVEIEYRLRHILIALPDSPSARQFEEAQGTAQKVWDELKAGGDFVQMATTYSDGPQALDGGDLGWRKGGQVPTLFANFVAGMQRGDISDLIRSPGGFHIIKLEDVRDSQKVVVTQTHSRHILIRPDELVKTEDARLRLEQLRQRIAGGDDFAGLAKGHSHDSVSAAEGGDLGWTSPGDLDPDFEQVMNSLKPGEVSQPFQTQFGWHIVQVLERREHDSTEDVKRARARDAIRARKLDEARDSWLREMRDEAYVEYRLESCCRDAAAAPAVPQSRDVSAPIRIGVTAGEPAGIGPDLLVALAARPCSAGLIAYGDPGLLAARAALLGRNLRVIEQDASAPIPPQREGQLHLRPVPLRVPATPGVPDARNSEAVLAAIRAAVEDCRAGMLDAIVTGPVGKAVINEAGIPFTGHTELIGELCAARLPVMMLMNDALRVVLVTTHLPLAAVSAAITPERLVATLEVTHAGLRHWFGIEAPHLLVCGLNPHAGEQGHLGREELEVIAPALDRLRARGLRLDGPVAADTAFTAESLRGVDAVVAMYHDQGLPPLKTRGFGGIVNVTLGLPIIRTSVDHGTALPLAGTGRARPDSLFAAIDCAIDMARSGAASAVR